MNITIFTIKRWYYFLIIHPPPPPPNFFYNYLINFMLFETIWLNCPSSHFILIGKWVNKSIWQKDKEKQIEQVFLCNLNVYFYQCIIWLFLLLPTFLDMHKIKSCRRIFIFLSIIFINLKSNSVFFQKPIVPYTKLCEVSSKILLLHSTKQVWNNMMMSKW